MRFRPAPRPHLRCHLGESTLTLAPGDALTFLSDGVLEARNPQGELFRFDRTREISRQSAEQIADTAARFGQEDDITVLTLIFATAEALHA
jgi:sigma-B regulation protein RsbU (phosphoserine phosphatase)